MIIILINEFLKAIEKAKLFFFEQIEKETKSSFKKNVHIYSHLDADGLSSAAILAKTLKRENLGFQITILKQLEIKNIKKISKEVSEYNRFIIFTDFGEGQIHIIKKYLKKENYLILDHHKPENLKIKHDVNQINPYYYDIKGEDEISSSGVCYLFSKSIKKGNIDLSYIGIVGSLGDMQNNKNKGKFHGFNTKILQDAIETGKIATELNIAISRLDALDHALAYSFPEKIPGISGNILNARKFFQEINIKIKNGLNDSRCLLDLSSSEKIRLNNGLLKLIPDSSINKLFTTNYLLLDFDSKKSIYNGRIMANLLNSCGRSGVPSLGISLLLGDKKSLEKALTLNIEYKKSLSKGVKNARKHIREYKNITTINDNSIDERIIGTICSILVHSENKFNKPFIGFADSDNHTLKVSARANKNLINQGLDLGAVMRDVSREMGIVHPAGGHPPAAGAKIGKIQLKEFIEKVDEKVGDQLKKSKNQKIQK